MAADPRRWRSALGCAAALLLGLYGAAAAAAQEPESLAANVIWSASGIRSGGALTAAAVCTNNGSVAATIGATFYQFNGAVACSIAASNVTPGESRTLSVDPVAALANGISCSGAPVINQGRVEISGNPAQTLKIDCTVMLVDSIGNPPASTARLKLYAASGAAPDELLFFDGFD